MCVPHRLNVSKVCVTIITTTTTTIIIIINIYHALINALSAHIIHINLNTILYTHAEHSPTKTIYIRCYMETHTYTYTHTHTLTDCSTMCANRYHGPEIGVKLDGQDRL